MNENLFRESRDSSLNGYRRGAMETFESLEAKLRIRMSKTKKAAQKLSACDREKDPVGYKHRYEQYEHFKGRAQEAIIELEAIDAERTGALLHELVDEHDDPPQEN
jgi:hypothetical protein